MIRIALALLALLPLAGIWACEVDDSALDDVHFCDSNSLEDQCGTTRSGRPMICYSHAEALGGKAFCTEACTFGRTPSDPSFACVAHGADSPAGALVLRCNPRGGASLDDPRGDCPEGLNCYRTDLQAHDGLCLPVPVCSPGADMTSDAGVVQNEGCPDPLRPFCAGSVVGSLFPSLLGDSFSDHLHCMQPLCNLGGRNNYECREGERCLTEVYEADYAHICLFDCDETICPPNFACGQGTDAPLAQRICTPGVPGNRCDSEEDCLVGRCIATDAGFGVCALPCPAGQVQCDLWNLTGAAYVCVGEGENAYCISAEPFKGRTCEKDADCEASQEERCFDYGPYMTENGLPECRVPCSTDGSCAPRGGLPHTCLGEAGGCYPGVFGMPCQTNAGCMPDLTCEEVRPDALHPEMGQRVCTVSCREKGCDEIAATLTDGYCDDDFMCRLGVGLDAPCTLDEHCRTRACEPSGPGGSSICVPGD